ncbi:LacI family DNA-binding transcriptional regulator [Oceaniglobus ichthyenteri]|uniref:LacI family DNA-binding transcriptional regulator n=1 Tax=Oceaniglobus ichthyenteri TaxID=2136177 RepID=UPI000D35875E|nr:substrate-binding domain-containing protein [Oceaniglobus ichthyenteri]
MNLRQLSALLGLSQTTVSRALNGYPEVSEATRQRVAQAARAHNYSPNTRAKSLATGRSMAIAHVIPLSSHHEMVNPVFADFIAGAGEVYAKNGYDMILSMTGDRDESKVYRDIRAKNTVDGLIIHAPRLHDSRLKLLEDLGLPFVVHGRFGNQTEGYHWLDMNNRRAFARATGFLAELGHRRIALLNGLEDMDFADRRRDGYLTGLANHGLSRDPFLMAAQEMTEYHGFSVTKTWLAAPSPPTAILLSSMILTMGARRAVHEAGLTLGRDISIISHDDDLSYFRNGDPVPEFTSLRSPVRDHGRRAAQMLLRAIATPDMPPQNQLLEAELHVGLSTGPAPLPFRRVNKG